MKCYDIPLSLNMWSELHSAERRERKKGMDGVNQEVGVERLFGNFRGLD